MLDVMKNVQSGSNDGEQKTMVVPILLTLGLCGVLTYHHATQDEYDHTISHFLATVLLQMFPLLLLKTKMVKCNDRLALVPIVIQKTLLMHLVLSALRLAPWAMHSKIKFNPYNAELWFDISAFAANFMLLRKVFNYPFDLGTLMSETEVRNLVFISGFFAAAVEFLTLYLPAAWVSDDTKWYISSGDLPAKVVFTMANYVDIVAFMPVVLKLYQAEEADDAMGTQLPENAKHKVILFCFFVVGYYSWDDVIDPIRSYGNDKGEAVVNMAHAAHYMLLLDFASFFLVQVWTPSSAKGDQLQGLLERGMDDED